MAAVYSCSLINRLGYLGVNLLVLQCRRWEQLWSKTSLANPSVSFSHLDFHTGCKNLSQFYPFEFCKLGPVSFFFFNLEILDLYEEECAEAAYGRGHLEENFQRPSVVFSNSVPVCFICCWSKQNWANATPRPLPRSCLFFPETEKRIFPAN